MFKFLKRRQPNPLAAKHAPATIDAQALLARIDWASSRRLDGLLQGNYRTLFRGAGIMLADLREYRPEDDVRHIDWNVTARMQTPYVREHEQDREITACFLIDLSPSIGFGSSGVSKRMVVAECVAALGQLLQGRGNRVGAIIDRADPQQRLEVIPTRTGKRHLLHVLNRVLNGSLTHQPGTTNLKQLLVGSQRVVRQRSTLFVVSDFYAEPGWDKALMALASRHDVVAIRLVDPLEQNLPDMGMVTMRDVETGEQLFIDTSDSAFRRRFQRQSEQHEEELLQALSRAGVDCIELRTDASVHDALFNFIRQRQQFLRQRSGGVRYA